MKKAQCTTRLCCFIALTFSIMLYGFVSPGHAAGEKTIILATTTSTQIGAFETATFTNNSGLTAIGRNLFVESASSGTAQTAAPGSNGYGTLAQNFTEGSNVNIVEEMASMITTQRAYEINSKAITTSDEMMKTTNNLI